MSLLNIKVLLVGVLLLLALNSHAQGPQSSNNLEEARLLTQKFGADLKSVLVNSMKTGGPIAALQECNIQAQPITESNALASGWRVSRTSLKVRNTNNVPDDWERKILLQFEEQRAAGNDLSKTEYSEVLNKGDKAVFRYMKPIITAGLCVSCHGSDLSSEITSKLQVLYPDDKATGFKINDIRGAYSLQKKVKLPTENKSGL
jgi:hypothetical protein